MTDNNTKSQRMVNSQSIYLGYYCCLFSIAWGADKSCCHLWRQSLSRSVDSLIDLFQ